jgi:hypothetical protein
MNLDKYDYICGESTIKGGLGPEVYRKLTELKKLTILRHLNKHGWDEIVMECTDCFKIVKQEKLDISEDLDMYLRLTYL